MEVSSGKFRRGLNSREADAPAPDLYEIRPRKDGCGFDLISDRLRRGPIWYSGPDAVRNAVAYAKYRSLLRSRRAIIRVLDHSESVIEAQ
jgi:hypothetical protein